MPRAYDHVHQRIGMSFSAMRASHPLLRKVEQAAIKYHQALQASSDAATGFFDTLEELANMVSDSQGPIADIGDAFLHVADTHRQMEVLRKELHRSFGEEVILPLSTKLDSDQRTVARMEKDYEKFAKQYNNDVRKAEKELALWAKKAKKFAVDGYSTANLAAAQQNVADRVADLEAMRVHTLRQALTEERRRYASLLMGLTNYMNHEILFAQQELKSLPEASDTVAPVCQNPNRLPTDFNPLESRAARKSKRMSGMDGPAGRPSMGGRPSMVPGAGRKMSALSMAKGVSGLVPAVGGTYDDEDDLPANQFRARYKFVAKESSQVSFNKNDIIEVDGEPEDNWQYGTNLATHESGWFPANYLRRRQVDSVSAFSSGSIPPPPVDYDRAPNGFGNPMANRGLFK